jgi:membrane protein
MKGFTEANIQLRASALTFYTILSIVPILAMIFGISKGFGFETYLKSFLNERLSEHQAILNELLKFVERWIYHRDRISCIALVNYTNAGQYRKFF